MTSKIQAVCRLCSKSAQYAFSKEILGQYNVGYFKCTYCKSLQTEYPYWLDEAYGVGAEKFDAGKATRTLENFFLLPSLLQLLGVPPKSICVDWGAGGGLLTRLLRDVGYDVFSYDPHIASEFSHGFLWKNQTNTVKALLAFEVVEHFSIPSSEWASFFNLSPEFLIVSTEIYQDQDDSWSYLAPESGRHIFFYSDIALALIASEYGYTAYNTGRYKLFCKNALAGEALSALNDWSNRQALNIESGFKYWRSNPYFHAVADQAQIKAGHYRQSHDAFVAVDMIFFQINNSGIARVWETLLRIWSETELSKILLVLDRGNTAPRLPGLRYLEIPSFTNAEDDERMLEEICQKNGIRIFLSSYYTKPSSTPSIAVIYDMIPEKLGFDLRNVAWKLKHDAIRHASGHICISHNTAADLSEYFSLDLENIKVAHCGVDGNFQPATLQELEFTKSKYGIKKPYFLIVGERGGYKNAGIVFSALKLLPNPSEYQIVCIGGRRELEEQFKKRSLGLDVLLFRVENDEIHSIYSGAVALVYPSLYEGFGLPVVEAFSCGCPVLTCRSGSIPEIAGEDVLYFDPNNAHELSLALESVQRPAIREKLVDGGLRRSRNFSWKMMAKTVADYVLEMAK
jgi:glycosyltransferase involved in cell wall biosynthesis